MDTYTELQTELTTRLQAADNSTLYPSSRIQTLIKDGHIWATTVFIWNELVRGRKTNSVATQDYYDYPEDFRTGTIIRLTVDDLPYDRKNFEDYLEYKRNNPTSTKRLFANFGRQYFITPTPSSSGVNNIKIWGAIQAPQLSGGTDKTIFSGNNSEGNEAIVKKAFSVAIKRLDPSLSQQEEKDAAGILAVLFDKQQKSTQRDQRIQHPFFNVPDFFATGNGMRTGNFYSNDPETTE